MTTARPSPSTVLYQPCGVVADQHVPDVVAGQQPQHSAQPRGPPRDTTTTERTARSTETPQCHSCH